ncbi:hypothetical protein [Rhizobium sp. PAMB 3182]
MSDFVEVIRRAVDGLKENTPERRAKVYEKARTAVVRQLENMKPAPPPAMLERQIEKLDQAIQAVELEHTEALPEPEPEPIVAPPPVQTRAAPSSDGSREAFARQASEAKAALSKRDPEPRMPPAEPAYDEQVAATPKRTDYNLDQAHNNLEDIINDLTGRKAPQSAPPAAKAPAPPAPAANAGPRMPKASDELDLDFQDEPAHKPAPTGRYAAGSAEDIFGEEDYYSDELDVGPATQRRGGTAAPAQSHSYSNGQYNGSYNGDFDSEVDEADEPASIDRMASRRKSRASASEEASSGNLRKIIIAAVCIVVLAGAGVAAWMSMSGESGTKTAEAVNTSAPAETTPAATEEQKPAAEATPAAEEAKPAATAPASDAQDAGPQKFTQRLMADGSEVNSGPASADGSDGGAEGRSVSEQSPGAQANADTGSSATPAATTSGAQKMLLYEEKLGQSAPTAIAGTVTWTLQQEASDDGRPEPTIQGQLSVPDKGLSALLTIKKNDDASLPASHLIELVFSLPDNFEGGGIDSVQRIAMKKSEQDRGNALVAVPAKITDDFHMIALNDFDEAKKANLELLRTRDWIDIPITYRNGRRALLTLEKGPTGKQVFDEALNKWAAMGNSGN